jgi:hypothetical protein
MLTRTARSVRSSSQSSATRQRCGSSGPELADPLRSLEVGKHQNVEELGAWSGTESIKALTEPALDVLQVQVDYGVCEGTAEGLIDRRRPRRQAGTHPAFPTEVVEAMNAEARGNGEPAEYSVGARHIARRILAATVLGFAMLIMLGGRSRADVLDPAQAAADSLTDTVGQVIETPTDTATETVSTVIDAATENVPPSVEAVTDAVDPVVGAVSDAVDPVVKRLGSVREVAETVLHGTKKIVPRDPSNPLPQPPISRVAPPNIGIPPASHAGPGPDRASADSITGSPGIESAAAASMSSSIAHPATNMEAASSSDVSHGHGGGPLPLGPFGRGVADGPPMLLVLFAAIAASLTVRPPPIRSLLASRVVAPNGAALALSVERPG